MSRTKKIIVAAFAIAGLAGPIAAAVAPAASAAPAARAPHTWVRT